MRAAGVQALIVTHPPNLKYLTGLSASAGALIVGLAESRLIVDSRYLETARAATEGRTGVTIRLASGGLDPAIAEETASLNAAAVGIEAAYLPVARYERLRLRLAQRPAGDAAAAPVGVSALVSTEGLVEGLRVVKDDGELATLREAARRLSA